MIKKNKSIKIAPGYRVIFQPLTIIINNLRLYDCINKDRINLYSYTESGVPMSYALCREETCFWTESVFSTRKKEHPRGFIIFTFEKRTFKINIDKLSLYIKEGILTPLTKADHLIHEYDMA